MSSHVLPYLLVRFFWIDPLFAVPFNENVIEVEDAIGLSDPWASCALVAQLKGRGDTPGEVLVEIIASLKRARYNT